MKKHFLALFILSSIFWQNGWAQDIEFSQFYAAPSHLNPAMIGFSDEARFVLNYRNQYPSFDNAWITYAASYDQHFTKYNSSIGFSVLADRAGGGLLNTYYVSGLYAYQVQFNSSLFLKAGAQVSFFQQSVDWGNLVFEDMINPVTGATNLPTIIPTPGQPSVSTADVSLGLLLYNENLYAGASFKHVTNPNLSVTDTEDPTNKLGVRTAFHFGRVFYLGQATQGGSQFYISPNVVLMNQGRFNQINVGAYVGKGVLFGGAWVRTNTNNTDALITMVGVKADVFRIGYSYDFNLGSLGVNTGSHEISFIIDMGQTSYAAKKAQRRKSASCPAIFQ
ncbi:MAG: PorP/SprF family type IX secretion system membrane protein [Chitinophagales bacterium]